MAISRLAAQLATVFPHLIPPVHQPQVAVTDRVNIAILAMLSRHDFRNALPFVPPLLLQLLQQLILFRRPKLDWALHGAIRIRHAATDLLLHFFAALQLSCW